MTTQHVALLVAAVASLALWGGFLYLILRRPAVPDSYVGKLFGFEKSYQRWETEGTQPSLHWAMNIWRHRKYVEHYTGRPIVLYNRVCQPHLHFCSDELIAIVYILAANEEDAREFFENEVTQPPHFAR